MRGGKRRERERERGGNIDGTAARHTMPKRGREIVAQKNRNAMWFRGSIFQNKRIKWPAKVRERKVSTDTKNSTGPSASLATKKRAYANIHVVHLPDNRHMRGASNSKIIPIRCCSPNNGFPPFYTPLAHPILLLKKENRLLFSVHPSIIKRLLPPTTPDPPPPRESQSVLLTPHLTDATKKRASPFWHQKRKRRMNPQRC